MSRHIAALSGSVTRKKVVYKNRYGLDITGELYRGKDLDLTRKHPAPDRGCALWRREGAGSLRLWRPACSTGLCGPHL